MEDNKMKSKVKRLIVSGLALAVIGGSLVACGQQKKETKSSGQPASAPQVLHIGTSGVSKPFSYRENGKLTGYDVEVVKALFSGLKQEYKVDLETTEFESILAGLDTDRYQLGANNFSYNAERAKKYNFSLPITKNPYVLVVRENDNQIKSLDDLTGKKAVTEVGNSGATLLENYNKNHSGKIDIQYTDQDFIKQFQNIEEGKYDVRIISTISAKQAIKEHGFKLKIVPFSDPSIYPDAYLLLPKTKDGDKLLKVVNQQIKKIYKDGTLEKISQEQLGASYLPDEKEINQ
ncbi:MAG: transporter substrate-binding domain-containing protein [Lactococcus plantarum]|nr:transporter substrate-binding domain-containing protein [Lactococcus plantarum]